RERRGVDEKRRRTGGSRGERRRRRCDEEARRGHAEYPSACFHFVGEVRRLGERGARMREPFTQPELPEPNLDGSARHHFEDRGERRVELRIEKTPVTIGPEPPCDLRGAERDRGAIELHR